MALPVVRNLAECAVYNSTVAPYLPQLSAYPEVLLDSFTNAAALRQLYLDTNPMITSVIVGLALAPVFLLVSEFNKNYSQVDRVWSILPTIYNAHYAIYAHLSGLDSTRLDVLFVVSAIWSARLTWNYYRKGGYSIGSEDYRWALVKDYIGPVGMFVLNVVFISFWQSMLLTSVTLPAYVLLLTSRLSTHDSATASWTVEDTVMSAIMLALVAVTFVADQQQWNYHAAKGQYQKTAKVPKGYDRAALDRGFLSTGLFAYSRHPNFAAEQSVWVTLYLWSCVATKSWYNWSGIGAILYLSLFQGSTWLTELLSAGKYPDYKTYQRQVGMFLPIPGCGPPKFSGHQTSHANGTVLKENGTVKSR